MGKGFKCGGSALGLGVDFRIRTFDTESALNGTVPENNTIGVVTTTAVTEWYIGRKAPSNPAEGTLWVETGNSNHTLSVVRDADIIVDPLAAHQYLSGKWESKTAKTYSNRWIAWPEPIVYLFKDGNQNTTITGGWTDVPQSARKIEMYTDGTHIATQTNRKIDLSPFSRLAIKLENYVADFALILLDDAGNELVFASGTLGIITMDLSRINSALYVLLGSLIEGDGGVGFTVSEVWLER